jgi:ABC-type sugar transport system substrate-binding protein
MALGATEVLLILPREQRDRVVVIGYDGIEEARLAIDRGDTPLRNTVVQDIDVLAEEVIQTLLRLLRNNGTVNVINKLKPRLYKNVQISSAP